MFKEAKQKLGLSYTEVGRLLGVDKGTAFSWVNDPGRASKEVVINVAKVLNVPEEEAVNMWREIKIQRYTDKL